MIGIEESKVIVPSDGRSKMEHVPVQVTMMILNKDNYLTWFAAITLGIVGQGRCNYIDGSLTPLAYRFCLGKLVS